MTDDSKILHQGRANAPHQPRESTMNMNRALELRNQAESHERTLLGGKLEAVFCVRLSSRYGPISGYRRRTNMLLDESKYKAPIVNESQILLNKVAKYIEVHGWCQNQEWDDQGRVCLTGAMRQVLPLIKGSLFHNRWLILDEIIVRIGRSKADGETMTLAHQRTDVMSWNDEEGRTKEQVLKMLRGR